MQGVYALIALVHFVFFFLYATCLQGRLGYPDAGVN